MEQPENPIERTDLGSEIQEVDPTAQPQPSTYSKQQIVILSFVALLLLLLVGFVTYVALWQHASQSSNQITQHATGRSGINLHNPLAIDETKTPIEDTNFGSPQSTRMRSVV